MDEGRFGTGGGSQGEESKQEEIALSTEEAFLLMKVGPDEASKLVKKFAEKQKVGIQLTEEQLNAILQQWTDVDPRLPAEITFYVGERAAANVRIAGYYYRGDTCCV